MVERDQHLHEPVAIGLVGVAVGDGEVEDDARPQRGREGEAPLGLDRSHFFDAAKIGKRDHLSPQIAVSFPTLFEARKELVGAHIDGWRGLVHSLAETVDAARAARPHVLPQVLEIDHQIEEGRDHLREHWCQIPGRILGTVDLRRPQKRLADVELTCHRDCGHPDVDAEIAGLFGPQLFGQKPACGPSRKTKVTTDGLAHPQTAEGPDHRVGDVVGDGAIVLVAQVDWADIVEAPHQRLHQVLNPLRGDALEVRVHHRYRLRVELDRRLEEVAEVVALALHALGGRDVDLGHLGRGVHECIASPVAGVVVDVDDDGLRLREILLEATARGVGRHRDAVSLVVRRNPDNNVGRPHVARVVNDRFHWLAPELLRIILIREYHRGAL